MLNQGSGALASMTNILLYVLLQKFEPFLNDKIEFCKKKNRN
jgi:hypothetical protein